MRKPFFSVVTNRAKNEGEILIYGIIGPDFWNDGTEARNFVQTLNYLEQEYDSINIRINSPGGSVWDGLAIFNAIRASKADIHTYNDGIAFSMAMIILLAGKTVHVAKGSLGMLHNAGGSADGNAADMREAALVLDKHDTVLTELIAERTGKTVDEVKASWMDYKDHFLSAQEMLDSGLADVIDEYPLTDVPPDPQNMSLHQIAAFYTERMEEPSPALLNKIFNHVTNFTNPNNMKFTFITSLSKLTAFTDEQVDKANAEFTEETGITNLTLVRDGFISDAAAVTVENTRLTGEVTALTSRATTAESALVAATNKISGLEAKLEALGKGPGANHENNGGDDHQPDGVEDVQALLAAMPHNKAADQLVPIKTKPTA